MRATTPRHCEYAVGIKAVGRTWRWIGLRVGTHDDGQAYIACVGARLQKRDTHPPLR